MGYKGKVLLNWAVRRSGIQGIQGCLHGLKKCHKYTVTRWKRNPGLSFSRVHHKCVLFKIQMLWDCIWVRYQTVKGNKCVTAKTLFWWHFLLNLSCQPWGSVCRNKSFPFYFIFVFFLRYPVEMLRNVAKLLSLVTLCTHCSYLSWTRVWTVWERVYFGGLELSAGISAFCLSSSCLLCFSFHLPVLNCRGCDFPSLSLKMKHSVASLTRLQSETIFFFFVL